MSCWRSWPSAAAIGLWVVLLVVGLGVYTPTLRRQIALVESDGAETAEYRALAMRGQVVGILLAAVVIVIVFLMVTKPTCSGTYGWAPGGP